MAWAKKDNIWLLTEERPKVNVVLAIAKRYCQDFGDSLVTSDSIRIVPIVNSNKFAYTYEVKGICLAKAGHFYIKTVSGNSSFIDFMLHKCPEAPKSNYMGNSLLMAIEETKTDDGESRNSSIYQRSIKFAYLPFFNTTAKKYMLYTGEKVKSTKKKKSNKPSDTWVFGSRALRGLDVAIIYADGRPDCDLEPFKTVDELIEAKAQMKAPTNGKPITITKENNEIKISGRLSKPVDEGNIAHDPNIGALSLIIACLRKLGWKKKITITDHMIKQSYIDRLTKTNKFLSICDMYNVKLDGITLPTSIPTASHYWHYEESSEKMADILLHIVLESCSWQIVYENHAGCERGYFHDKNGNAYALPKKDRFGDKLYLPDLIMYNAKNNIVILIEGKKASTLKAGLKEIEYYDSIEQEYIFPNYSGATIVRGVSIYGAEWDKLPHDKVMFYLSKSGRVIINDNAPEDIKKCFESMGFSF